MTREVKAQIRVLATQSLSQRSIAHRVGHSKSAVGAYLKGLGVAKTNKKLGRKPILSAKTKRLIIRDARKGEMSARELAQKHNSPVSVRRLQQILQAEPSLRYTKPRKEPGLTKRHKNERRIWCGEMAKKDAGYWDRVIFSDEKRFLLDGPDGPSGYWADTRAAVRVVKRRQAGGGGIMMWGGLSSRGVTKLVAIKDKVDSPKYCQVLEVGLLPYIDEKFGEDSEMPVFQQDGAPSHTSNYTREWLMDAGLPVLEWPSKSPDLNPVENAWAWLCRRVYGNNRQYDHVKDLVESLHYYWSKMPKQMVSNLARSLPTRCGEVLSNRGGPIDY